MNIQNRVVLVSKKFSDTKNYPYGFSRSGDFSIAESNALSNYGCLIAALVDGVIIPSTPEEQSYLDSALGHQSPTCDAERAWCKYQSRINRPKYASIYGSKKVFIDTVLDDLETVGDEDDT